MSGHHASLHDVAGDPGRPGRRAVSLASAPLRAAFIEGAERDSLRRLGRGLTAEELERVAQAISGGHVMDRVALGDAKA